MRSGRLIALIDMDAFYVQVEVRDRPELQDKPVAVVQYNQIKNGGLIAVGYKARAEGVKRSMRADEALQKCPSLHLVSTPVRGHKSDLTKYRKASAEVFAVLNSFDENIVVEKASIDEAYLDLTKVVDRRIREEMVGEERLDSGRYPATYVLCPHVSAPEENREERLTEWLELCSREEEEMRLALAAETVERIRAAVLSQTKFHCSAGELSLFGPETLRGEAKNHIVKSNSRVVGERKRRSLAKKPKKTKKRKKMAAAAPGDIKTEPNAKIVYNAPFSEKNVYNVLLQNNGAHRIGWAIKTTNMKRLAVEPPAGCLDPKESQMLTIYCEPFAWGQEDTNNDRIFFEWTNTPEGAAKQFRREWFQGDGMVRRKNIPIECNP